MKQKLIKSLILSMLMAVVLTGCGQNADEPSSSGFSGGGVSGGSSSGGNNAALIKVGIINSPASESSYRAASVKNFTDVFTQTNGYDARFFYSFKKDEQIQAVSGFITDNVEYLLICTNFYDGWNEVIQTAKNAGIKVFFYDGFVPNDVSEDLYECAVMSDLAKEGQTAVNWLKAQNLSEYNRKASTSSPSSRSRRAARQGRRP